MGLTEVILEHVSLKTLPLVGIALWGLWMAMNRIKEHRRIKSIGSYTCSLHPRLPFALDFMYHGIRSTLAQKNLELWRDDFFAESWTCEMRVLNQRICFTADPDNIKAILATQFHDFGKGAQFHEEWSDFLGDSIFTTDGAQWHNSRQLIRPQFTRDRVSDLHCFEAHIQTLFKTMANGGPLNGEDQAVDLALVNGRRIDICELFFRYTLDVATDFLLGNDVKSLSTPKQDFAESFNEVQRIQNILIRVSKLRRFIPKRAFFANLGVINHFVNHFIQRALRMSPDELAAHTKSDKDYTFLHELASFTRDPKILRDQIVAVLLAGRDTTASTLSWALYELSRHPQAVARLRNEILETVGEDRLPTYDHLKNMPYLKAVLNETLRLYPSVPFNMRIALKDTTLPRGGGPDGSEPIAILKDTPIGYSTLVMQRRADLYPPVSDTFADPGIFSPERWAVWHPKPHDYIPFNAGPRICIGQQFALTEMSYTLCRIFQRFERVQSFMHEVDGGEPLLKSDIVLSPGQGVQVAFWEAKKKTDL